MADLQSFAQLFGQVWRDFKLAGVPASGANEPEKQAIRAIGQALDLAIAAASAGDLEAAIAMLQPIADEAAAARDETRELLDDVAPLLPQALSPDSGYLWGLVDGDDRAAILVGLDGSVTITKHGLRSIPGGALRNQAVTTDQIAPQAVGLGQLTNEVQGFLPQTLSADSGYVWAITDAEGRMGFAVKMDGAVLIPKIILPDGVVTAEKLATSLKSLFPQALSPDSGYLYAITDAEGRIGFGIKTDGSVTGRISGLSGAFVTPANLEASFARQVVPYATDVVAVRPDPLRAGFAEVAVRTGQDGSAWETLPHSLTTHLRGVNGAGVSVDIRRASGLIPRGKRYCGGFDPGALASVNSRGSFTVSPAASAPAVGDYLQDIATADLVVGSDTYRLGDLAVYSGSAWIKQAAPAPFGGGVYSARQPGDWWIVTAAGTFDGVSYAVGDRIVHVGFQSASGQGYARWAKGDHARRGDLFYRGEFAPSAGLPPSPADGELYQASAAGSAGGFVFSAGDYLVREGGVWGHIPTEAIQTVVAGGYVCLPCIASAAEWEVRRTDKGANRAGFALKGPKQSNPRRHRDELALWSDSMFGVSGVGASIISKAARPGNVFSYGGGTSRDVLAMIEYEILRLGDRYRGRVHVLWHGQNNQPSTAVQAAQVREVSLKMEQLIGARDDRVVFMSILGQRTATWNAGLGRIVSSQFEDAFAGTAHLWALEQWYGQAFAGQWISTRQALLAAAAASNLPDPWYPGMTEAQVAAAYGIVPYSFFNLAQTLPVAQSALVYQGTRATAGLPSGGAANDYFLRIGGGTVGNLLINVASVWTEFALDVTHLSPNGADALSSAVAAFLKTNHF